VAAFEANPGIAKRCQSAVVEAGCGNVQIVHSAIYSRSGESIDLYISENQVADSIHYRVSENSIKVPTLALDDYVTRMKINPSFVKMDIEGAEYDALLGFEKTIKFARPIMILEQAPSEARCVDFLVKNGYRALDLSTYQEIGSISEISPDTAVTDILFAYGDGLERIGYGPGTTPTASMDESDFLAEGNIVKSKLLPLERGRYIVKASFASADDEAAELFCGAWVDGSSEPLMRHHGHSNTLSKLAHRWIFDISHAANVSIFFHMPQGIPKTFKVASANLSRVSCKGALPPYWL
jgi:FkbM family methyltransferase